MREQLVLQDSRTSDRQISFKWFNQAAWTQTSMKTSLITWNSVLILILIGCNQFRSESLILKRRCLAALGNFGAFCKHQTTYSKIDLFCKNWWDDWLYNYHCNLFKNMQCSANKAWELILWEPEGLMLPCIAVNPVNKESYWWESVPLKSRLQC